MPAEAAASKLGDLSSFRSIAADRNVVDKAIDRALAALLQTMDSPAA